MLVLAHNSLLSVTPVIVSWAAKRLDVFGLGTDYLIYKKYLDGNHSGRHPLAGSRWAECSLSPER